ncbi:hypothetical protein ACFFMP_21070 [Pseudoroseomonas cervicalis]|uniref:Uncharacterized protein n=1 Tax=Pseudoroseomonas cervicalis ATCC 49957 TaxID=525371 RepID=D5RPP8_9PROT|nr:hypothetical protein [Pseudoroseomonas cervicalis]EFH10719.1 hypothetical protein HMPREF0731_3060 [Pseudoroseomonas cervicalis ATCC 49957]
MDAQGKPTALQSWIAPQFGWSLVPDIFVVDVPLSDPDAVEFISTGVREVTVIGNKKILPVLLMMGIGSLQHALMGAVWDRQQLRPSVRRLRNGTKVVAYCWGAFLCPADERLLLLVGRSKSADPSPWLDPDLKAAADAAFQQHCATVAAFEEEMRRQKEKDEALVSKHPEMASVMAKAASLRWPPPRPVVTAECLRAELPVAVTFAVSRGRGTGHLDTLAIKAIAASNAAPSRDGSYIGVVPSDSRPRTRGLVTWTPHNGLPAYPEIRCALQARLPAAFRRPLNNGLARPKLDSTFSSDSAGGLTHGDRDPPENMQELSDIRLDLPDADRQREGLDAERTEVGFDAIAWYQPHHQWTNGTWGIYFDARKLDVLAYSLHQDFMSRGVRVPQGFAAFLAFNLTYAHEMFHARVEATLSWLELTAMQPRFLRYGIGVYDALRETPEWFEEALANWTAWQWFKSDVVQSLVARWTSRQSGVDRIVEAALDLSPPGYRDWRVGAATSAWRTFATQLVTGKPKPGLPRIGLPVESVLLGPLAYDFRPTDVPLRFVGRGVIADVLQSRPASLNVPSRREIERALKHFGHRLDPSGGKGSHEQWTGPDNRAFYLPKRDPVSPGVFKTFLHHLGIDKATYIHGVRPRL